jgi:hypothetical protein
MPRRGPEAGSPHKIIGFTDFHGSGVNSRSRMFLLSQMIPVRTEKVHPDEKICNSVAEQLDIL